MMIVATAAKIYQVIIVADEDQFATYEPELQEIDEQLRDHRRLNAGHGFPSVVSSGRR